MSARRSSTCLQYAVAVLSIGVATLTRVLLDPILGNQFPFATVFFAVLLSAWYGGFGPALLASAAGALFSVWYLLPPRHSLAIDSGIDQAGLLLYAIVSAGIALIGGAMHKARRRAEESSVILGAQREQLRVTLESIGDAVITTDTQGRVTAINPVAADLTAWQVADAIGRPLTEVFAIINEDSRRPVENPVDRVLSHGHIVGLANHTVLVARDGGERPIDDSAAPIRDRDGNVIGAILVFRDVSEARRAAARLRRSEQELSDFFENANVGLHFVGPDGIIQRVNRAELELLGYSRDEYVGHHIAEFHTDPEVIEDILRRLKAGETLHGYRARMRCKDDSIREVSINSSVRWDDGQFIHTRCFTLDVTAQRRADEARALLASVVESSEDAIITKTLDGVITSWNAGAERLFGYRAEEAIGQPIQMIIPPERQAEEREIIARLRAGERIEHFETMRVAKDGRRIEISITVSPVRAAGGRIIGASKIARDITARRRGERAIRESEDRFLALAANAPAAIFLKDREGRYTLANPLACQALGRNDAVGHTDHELLPETVADELRRRDLEVISTGQPVEAEEVVRRPGYDRRFLSVKFPLFGDDGPVGVCGVAIDITDRKRAEEELVAADRRKDAFLATLAHELRNPLAPLRNSVEIMKRSRDDASALDQVEAVMDRQVAHLQRLVDDLLEVSRISQNRFELRREQVELTPLLQNAIETARPACETRRLELAIAADPEPIHLDADPVRLTQVFTNLLSNACKFTESGGRIWITSRREGGDAVVSVRDTGVGIPPEMLSSIFDMFIQLGAVPDPKQGGLGIGLTLVRQLVEMHGGSVEARSDGLGRGSEFIVRVPMLTQPAQQRATPTAATTTHDRRHRILVVDDNEDAAQSLAVLLEMEGHEIQLAHDGAEAVSAARSFHPEIVLLDIGLPEMSGHEVAQRIRAEPWGRDMTLIALTGWGQEGDRRKSREVGFDHHLVKPVDPDALMRLLASR